MTEFGSLSWEQVAEGEALPGLEFGPISVTTQAMDVAGTRDLYPIHHDRDFAKAAGARDIFLNTMWYQGLLGRYVTDWAGPESFLRKLGFDMRGTNCPGDTLQVRGTVTRKYEQDGQKLADLDVRIDNQLQPDTVVARITVELV
jgi:acyl dehydratase